VVPETLGALVAFLCFIVPGLVFELLRERRRPFIEETAFREASRIGLTSVLFTLVACLVLALVRALRPSWIADPSQWLRDGQKYAEQNLVLVVMTLVAVMTVAILFALLVDWLFRRSAPGRIAPGSIWFSLFREHRPEGATPWVHLRLSDETEIWGYAGDYTPDQALENRELLVEGPELQYRRKGATKNTPLGTWSFISVRGADITWMKIQYIKPGASGAPNEIVPAVYSVGHRWRGPRRKT